MKFSKKTTIVSFFLLIFLSALVYATTSAIVSDPVESARRITACILKITKDASPYIAFALLLIGGVTYISAVEDSKQRILGKKFGIMGIVGLLMVQALVLIAASPPFNIPTALCVISGGGGTPPGPPGGGGITLIAPPNGGTIGPFTPGPGPGPSTTAGPGPSTTAGPGPSTTAGPGPSTTVSGPTTTASGPTTTVAGPATGTWTDACMPPVQNQGNTGTCWAHTLAAIAAAELCDGTVFSELAIACGRNPPVDLTDGDPQNDGATMGQINQVANDMSSCATTTLVDESCGGASPTGECPDISGCTKYTMAGTTSVPMNSADFQTALTNGPVQFLMTWDTANWNSDGTWNGGSGGDGGGHAVVITGYDAATDTFTIQNSWGTGAGDNGMYHLPASQLSNVGWPGGASQPGAVTQCP